MSPEKYNDAECIQIKPFIKRILALNSKDFCHAACKDRLKWLQYWCKKAIELYDEDAAISFT